MIRIEFDEGLKKEFVYYVISEENLVPNHKLE